MENKSTKKEAKDISTYYKNILKKIDEYKVFDSVYNVSFKNTLKSLISKNYFQDKILQYFKENIIDYKDADMLKYIFNIYYYANSIQISIDCNNLSKNYSNIIENSLKSISPKTNSFSWFFTSKKRKEEADNALFLLNSFKNKEFIKEYQKLENQMEKLKVKHTNDEILNDFQENNTKYKDLLIKKNNSYIFYNNNSNILINEENTYNKLLTQISNIRLIESNLKNDIIKAINAYRTFKVTSSLKEISVNELSKAKKGIRVKLLIEAGIVNYLDLYSYSAIQISSINGISYDNALTIKRIIKSHVDQIFENTKIKLTYDDKGKIQTEIVADIYKFLHYSDYFEQLNKLETAYNNKLNNAFNHIKKYGDYSVLPFLKNDELILLKEDYNFIKTTLNDTYIPSVNKIVNIFKDNSNSVKEQAWDDFKDNSIKYYNVIEQLCPGVLGKDNSLTGLSEELVKAILDEAFFPDGLLCTLRKYQEFAVKYILHQEKILLGDEMGLGKTIEAIATMVSLKNTGATHFLVICPASVVSNWCREIIKHSKLRVTKIYGNYKQMAFNSWVKVGDVAVTNYESLSSIHLEDDFKFDMLTVDEAHYIKNNESKRSERTINLMKHTSRILLMTGTALENNVEEMISLISYIRNDIANQVKPLSYLPNALIFREKIAPVYFRRKREDVLTELPDKIENEEWCVLNQEEEKNYEENIKSRNISGSRKVSWNVDDLNLSSKANRLKEIIEEAEKDDRKVLVFSFYLEVIYKLCDYLGDRCLNPISGSVPVNRRQEIIDEFESSKAGSVLLCQINSGGTGLNIQAASVVVICEPQLKPSIENQAISRAYRMGQARKVLVYRLLAENTIDERMLERLKNKQVIFDNFADKSVAAEKQVVLDENSLKDIIQEEIDRINSKKNNTMDVKNETVVYSINESSKMINNSNNINPSEVKTESNEYYENLMDLNYDELVDYLLKKYGKVNGNYFIDEGCNYKNKNITRGNEGLFIHHIDEDKAILLSNPKIAIKYPYDYQKANRLVYSNYLEHLLLHILIFEKSMENKTGLFGIGGAISYITGILNDIYNGYKPKTESGIKSAELIIDNFEAYIEILKYLCQIIAYYNYDLLIPKESLARGFNNKNIYENILDKIKDF